MKKSVGDLIFNRKFRDDVSKRSIENYADLKRKDPVLALAALIAYVLKFKRKDISQPGISQTDFFEIKTESLKLFHQHQSSRITMIRYLKIAAAASVLLLFAVGGYRMGTSHLFSDYAFQSGVIEFNTPKGQQSELTLPDGTFVALNYDSKLKYRISPDHTLQEVELDGEAFFKVTKDRSRTFRVITPEMNVNVLGTEFDIRAYKNDLQTETTLVEGRVEITDIPEQQGSVFLKPGEKWSYNKTDRQQAIVKVNPQLSTLWRNGEYYFEKVPLGELAKTLERMYKVTIHFQDPGLENEVYSGSVYQDDDINKVFGMINLTVPVTVKTQKDEIWIKRK